ncbi:hypothetical protein FA13DRAFT_336521 [Coprinellus micaceus]|uniref:Uncharacterized protein n=1 Tax=Coprinellus micaceus TaxID=71717 RepID=A0A4Y7TCF3_COPMI|nr:hypothetical protein FA13DRAFT_336521 [Coprinellus micaceus]
MDTTTTTAGGNSNVPSTPFRRPRVTSMPSSNKTPLAVDRDRLNAANHQYYQQTSQGRGGLGPMSSMRTTLRTSAGGKMSKEDLTSYEAAVLARKTPMNLNMGRLSSRRRGGSVNPPGGPGSGLSKASWSGDNLDGARAISSTEGCTISSSSSWPNRMGVMEIRAPAHLRLRGRVRWRRRRTLLPWDMLLAPTTSTWREARGRLAALGWGCRGLLRKRLASSVLESGTPKAMKFDDTPHSPSSIPPVGSSAA